MANRFDPRQAAAKQKIRQLVAGAMFGSGLTGFLQRSSGQRWRILTYHRITSPEVHVASLQPGMYVRPRTFEMQIQYLHAHCNVVPLDELTASIREGRTLPPKTVAITFDDGWHDNYENAYPMLAKLRMPATIFLATSFIGTRELFWTDRVAQTLTALRKVPQFREPLLAKMKEKFPPRPEILGHVETILSAEDEPAQTIDSLIEAMKNIPPAERKSIVNDLYFLAKEFTTMKSERVFVNWDEVVEMAGTTITFGSHSHHHHRLTELNGAQLKDELVESYQELRSHGIKPVSSFCYPGGYHNDATQQALKAEGIGAALTTERGSRFDIDPLLFGRVHIHEDMTSSVPMFTSRIWGPGI